MSVKPIRINVIDKNKKRILSAGAYERITLMNLRRYLNERDDLDTGTQNDLSTWKRLKIKFKQLLQSFLKLESNFETQLDFFQSSMKYCLISGQCLGLLPIINVTEKNVEKLKCSIFSWRYLLCFIILLAQMVAVIISFCRLTIVTITVKTFGIVIYLMSNCIKSVLFIRLSTKWDRLIKIVATLELNEYIDLYVKIKCKFATIAILSLAFTEHMLSVIWKFIKIYDCGLDDINKYEQLTISSNPWVFDLKVPYSIGIGIFMQIFNLLIAIIWSYAHIFIICISLYLASILNLLNKKIISHEGQHLPASYWRALREDYNRATRLVHSFDDAINSIVFTSIGSNLFFVCSQIYYLLGQSLLIGNTVVRCPNNSSGLLHGYENVIYFTFSTIFVLSRSLAVLLIAAKIHSASLVAAPSLYSVPSSSYSTEVQRFLEQIHGDTVALTDLNFFYVTKELVLSVIGTIVTYELVLLQFNKEEHSEDTL